MAKRRRGLKGGWTDWGIVFISRLLEGSRRRRWTLSLRRRDARGVVVPGEC